MTEERSRVRSRTDIRSGTSRVKQRTWSQLMLMSTAVKHTVLAKHTHTHTHTKAAVAVTHCN
jgi:hypothetical protein